MSVSKTAALALLLALTASVPAQADWFGKRFCNLGAGGGTHCDTPLCDGGCDGANCDRYTGRAFLFGWPCSTAQDLRINLSEPLSTDRPDFTEASRTVGLGVTQLEMGYTYTTDDEGGRTNQHTYPELLVRHGIFRDWLELRLAYTANSFDTPVTSGTGSEDLYLGLKIGLTPQYGYLPEMALIPQMTVPSGSRDLTSDKVLGGLNWIYAWEVCDWLSIAGSTQFNRTLDESTGKEYTQWARSAVAGFALTDTIGAYTEYFGFYPHRADDDPVEHYLNGGFTKLFGNNVQWDVRAGMGLTRDSDDFFVGTGLTVRFL